jgi:hypothetical protein
MEQTTQEGLVRGIGRWDLVALTVNISNLFTVGKITPLLRFVVAGLFFLSRQQFVCIGTLPGLANSERPLVDASSNFLGASGALVAAEKS